jgi:predicted MFS family arabinose efflux permease
MFPQAARPFLTPFLLLACMTFLMQISFASWWTLIKNFAVEEVGANGFEIGLQESIREIPGFLAFTAIYLLLFLREQTLALLALLCLGAGVAITGSYPTLWGFYITTLIMSVGFHYFETMNQSLALQWLPRERAPHLMGRLLAVAGFAQLLAYGGVWLLSEKLAWDFQPLFLLAGSFTLAGTVLLWIVFPRFEQKVVQNKSLIMRRRYWLYYALTFMGGARRQIFTVFAGFMMVEKFGYSVSDIALLFLINCIFNMVFAPLIGRLIGLLGERRALSLEYIGLAGVFIAYAFVEDPLIAAALYVIDHGFFALSIAMKTYFQKIADPRDIAPTAGVAFTINHIAAVFIPAGFGLIWLISPAAVFLLGAGMAMISLCLARLIPPHPQEGQETIFIRPAPEAL